MAAGLLEDNDVRFYPNNTTVVQAVGRGDVQVGLVNHYYLYNLLADTPDLPVRNHWFRDGDPATSCSLPVWASSRRHRAAAAAQRFVDFLLSKTGQRLIARGPGAAEYPRREGGATTTGLRPLESIKGPKYNLGRLAADLAPAVRLLLEEGFIKRPRARRPRSRPTAGARRGSLSLLRRSSRSSQSVPIVYLVFRALADVGARALVPLTTTVELARDTAILALGVVVATVLVGVPLAWLVVRTDPPGRRLPGRLAPARDPELRGGARTPRRLRAAGSRPGAARAPLGVDRLPEVASYRGALVALTPRPTRTSTC